MAGLRDALLALPATYLAMWATLVLLTVGLAVLVRTRWGRERPTHRYVLLSVVGHLLLICLATTVRFFSAPVGEPASAPVRVRIVMATPSAATQPEPVVTPEPPQPVVVEPLKPLPEPTPEPAVEPVVELQPQPTEPIPVEPIADDTPPPLESAPSEPAPSPVVDSAPATPQPVDMPPIDPTPIEPPPVEPPPVAPIPPQVVDQSPESAWSVPQAVAPAWRPGVTEPVAVEAPPTPYGARVEDERLRVAERDGGSRVTEDAVAAAMAWLAAAQSNDGRWDANRWSAGRERRVLGHDRRSAGVNADTGVTGLALLALMGAGHTHADEGPYAETVRAGLEFLLAAQWSNGDLAGDATQYARTYCHSMATFALAEALAHTRDERLTAAVERGVRFLVDRQHQASGGWRYQPGQPGDMSQMGWIVMALRSAELGGVAVPPATWAGIERFVDSVRRGDQRGLACYRRDGPVSRTMTAEALYCRQILGASIPPAAGDEAVAALLGGPPGSGRDNLYYWYYATLALHHHRHANGYADSAWRTWNDAMTRSLVGSQVGDGVNAGSWSPNTLWGGYGGRVYSTAMAAMCLEVYYRYDPQQLVRDPWIAARPGGGTLR